MARHCVTTLGAVEVCYSIPCWGACEAEINTLFLTLQYGMVQELQMAVGTRPPELLLTQLVQKLRTRVPLDETATRWDIKARAEAFSLQDVLMCVTGEDNNRQTSHCRFSV